MRYLLDTNVLSDARKRVPRVVDWLDARPIAAMAISAVTLMEIEIGVRLIERRDHLQGNRLRSWIEQKVKLAFADRIVPVDDSVAVATAGLHVPDPMPSADAYIAATALVHKLTLVTHNVADFERTDVKIIDPYWS